MYKSDLSGADLSGARLRQTVFGASVSLAGSNLSGADARGVILPVDLRGADISNARLGRARLDASVFLAATAGATLDGAGIVFAAGTTVTLAGHDFGPAGLVGVSFAGKTPPGNLRGADFRRATLNGASFRQVDLSGARFTVPAGAASGIQAANFFTGVICPDGRPPTAGAYGWAACRLRT